MKRPAFSPTVRTILQRLLSTALLLVILLPPRAAHAADAREFWPELSLYVKRSRLVRFFFDLSYAQGKESFSRALDMAGSLDLSIKPVGRKRLQQEDWARNRYLWARIGYVHILKGEGGVPSPAEDRGVVALLGKLPLPGDVWLEGRTRADLRWISDTYSTRYRFRAEVTREFTLGGFPVTPYFNAEWFWDTRYDGWSRTLYQLGPEVTLSKRFRFEVYGAHQVDRLPRESTLDALGVVGKWYF